MGENASSFAKALGTLHSPRAARIFVWVGNIHVGKCPGVRRVTEG